MKLHNIPASLALATIMAVGAVSCDSDIEEVYVKPSPDITLAGASSDIILTPDNPQALAMTLYWSGDGRLELSDSDLQAPVNAAEETIQLSMYEDFLTTIDLSVDKGVRERQFLCEELNSLLGRLGVPAEELTPVYIRIRSVLGANIAPSYSDVLTVNVKTYSIHLNLATVLDKDWNETSMQLASPEENGIYTGFMGVTGWYNWWLRENNNLVWGNLGQDGKVFYASSDDDHWNFWFPNPAGCYFTTVNTVEGWWSALHIDNLSVSGDFAGEMTFSNASRQWTMPIAVPAGGTYNIRIEGAASLYDVSTTDMGPAIAKTVGFSGTASALAFGEGAASIAIELPAGETTLVVDLSNPLVWTVAAGEAAPEPEASQYLYFSGVTNWDGFDTYLTLYDEAALSYGGAHWVDSEWGYRAYTEADWASAYKAADDATPLAGNLVFAESDGNIPAPEKGLYVMDFSMKALTYNLTPITSVSYTGLNDDWSLTPMQQSADNPEVFTAEFVKTAETPWGVKVIINDDWGLFFGGGEGILLLGHSDATTGFDGDNSLTIGQTYVLTVDLGKQTYTYSLK